MISTDCIVEPMMYDQMEYHKKMDFLIKAWLFQPITLWKEWDHKVEYL